jgi:AhpD family alkylhydroperoxidase
MVGVPVRVDYARLMPEAYRAMSQIQSAVDSVGLEPELLELIKIRASQLNGCAYCLDMHTKDAAAIGVDEQKVRVLAAWREAPIYSERQRAALAWCEALTHLPDVGAPEPLYLGLASVFSPLEMAAVTFAIVVINGWNRLAVGLGSEVGTYVSSRTSARTD